MESKYDIYSSSLSSGETVTLTETGVQGLVKTANER